MPEIENFKVDLGALINWRSMPETWRAQLRETFNKLATLSPEQLPRWVTRLPRPPHWYMMPGPEDLRVFFQYENGGALTIKDFMRQEAIDRLSGNL